MPFTEVDAAYFFGRERESDLILANLTASRLTLLYAPSGVGKSSVLRAGVLPRLHQIDEDSYEDLGTPGAAVAYVNQWSTNPVETVAAAIDQAISGVRGAGPLDGPVEFSVPGVRDALRQSGVSGVYLILDQFEEYFLYHPADRGEEGLTAELGRILSARDLRVHVLLSIREDALAGLDRFKGRVPHLFDNYLRLAHLGRDAAQAAIEGPLAHFNLHAPSDRTMSVEPGLTASLLDQVRTGHVVVGREGTTLDGSVPDDRGEIETPYLQLVLMRLWEQERALGSSSLRASTLDELGGAQTIVQTHLDNVMANLSPEQVDVAAAVFHHLVTRSGSKIALTADDLADWSGQPSSAVYDLLETLSSGRQRILRPVPPAVGVVGPPRYEIFHDIMGAAVLDWRRRYLVERQQFESARMLVAEREEARAAARVARQRLHQTRLVAAGMALVLVITGALGVVAYLGYREAEQQRLLSEAAAAIGIDSARSLQHAVSAYDISGDPAAREAVLTAASIPRSRVVAGPRPNVVGMVLTPDSRNIVAYDDRGGFRVIGDDGTTQATATASGLDGKVIAAAVNPDASRVVLATDRGAVAVVDVATGDQTNIQTGGESFLVVSWLGSSSDGIVLVTSSGVAATYDAETGQPLTRFPDVYEALPMADGAHVVTSGDDGRLRVWDARTAAQVAESSTLASPAFFLSRYGQSVVGLSRAGPRTETSIVVWDWRAGPEPVQHPPFVYTNEVQQVVVDEDAGTITIAMDKTVWRYSLLDGEPLSFLPQHADWVHSAATSPDGRWLATGGGDGRVLVWSTWSPSRPTYELLAQSGAVGQLSYVRDGAALMSVGVDGTVRLWELPPVQRFDEHLNWVLDLDLSGDGSWLATAGTDGYAYIVDPTGLSKEPVATVSPGSAVTAVRFDPTDAHRVVTLARYGTVPQVWRWGDGTVEPLPGYEEPPLAGNDFLFSLAISPDGSLVAAGDGRGSIHVWDARTGTLLPDRGFLGTGQGAWSVTFDPSGQLLAAAGLDGVRLWDLDTAGPPRLLRHPNAATVAFDHSGEHLVSGAEGGTVNIWTREGTLVHELVAHGGRVSQPSFSDDDSLLAVGTAEGLVEVWDARSGDTVTLSRQHGDSVNNVLFAPDDRSRLISASDDSTVARWPCPACSDPDAVIRDALTGAGEN